MSKDDPTPPALVGRAGLVFAYVCFATSVTALCTAIYILPLDLKAKLFLGAGAALMISLFAFMAVATHLVWRGSGQRAGKSRRKAALTDAARDADGSQRPR